MPEVDLEQVARDLAATSKNLDATSKNLDRHITAEGKKIGGKLGVTYAKAAKGQVDDAKADARRWQDCNTELRRQMKQLDRYAATLFHLEKTLQAAMRHARATGTDIPARAVSDAINAAHAAGTAVQDVRTDTDNERQLPCPSSTTEVTSAPDAPGPTA